MKDGLYEVDSNISRVDTYDPEVTPNGKPEKVGVVVATPAVPDDGTAVQQWICAAVVVPSKPENVTSTFIVLDTSSIVTTAMPVPGDAFAGDSLAPFRSATYLMIVAWANGAATNSDAVMARKNSERFIASPLVIRMTPIQKANTHPLGIRLRDEIEARIKPKNNKTIQSKCCARLLWYRPAECNLSRQDSRKK
jgi:hypothetical protein